MQNIKNQRRLLPAELLIMLDLEERIMLAGEFHLTPPANLKDKAFLDNISKFSATTLLNEIIHLKRPFIWMLQDIYNFMEVQEASGRTTTRAVVLPSARRELFQLLLNPALKDAIATTLNSQTVSDSIDSLEKRATKFRNLVKNYMEDIRGSIVTDESNVSRYWRMRKKANLADQYDPSYPLQNQFIAKIFDRRIHAYNPEDFRRVEIFQRELKEIFDTFYRVTHGSGENNWLPLQTTNGVLQAIKSGIDCVQDKLQYMEEVNCEVRKEIYEGKWDKLLENMRILKEEIFAVCNFQTSATAICDFLNLDMWRERSLIYEIWTLTHILRLFENLGFKLDISARMSNGVWNLKFTKDQHPVALLLADNAILKVYYQLYLKSDCIGNVKGKESGKYLFSWDEIPGNDNEKLVEFLETMYDICWVTTAKIEKIDGGKTIRVITESNSILLRLNAKKNKVNLKIDDGRTFKLNARTENSKLNIYSGDNMPDIAIKKNDNEYLLVLDPKYGLTYKRGQLTTLAHRYADAFLADLTVIHNFYPMSYNNEVFSKNHRCLILSDIRPGSEALSKFDHDIISVIPDAWLPASDSIVILVDVSESIQSVQNRIIQAIDNELRHCFHHASPDSVLLFFNDKIVKEILISDIQNTNEVFISEGGTNLAAALETAIKKLMDMHGSHSLLFFTDGKDSFDIFPLSQKILSAGLQVWIYEAVDSNDATSLQKLAQIIGGQYQRI